MMNTWKKNLDETKQRYVDWWNRKGIILNMWEHFQEGVTPHADIPAPAAPVSLDQKWFDPKWRADYLDWYVAHSSLKADILPVANTQLGPGSLAAILGGVFEGGPDTIWIHPDPNYSDDLKFDENHPNWILHKELLKACKAKAQGHYYVGMPDLMEGLDVLAAIKGTDKVLLDTVMQPDVLEHQMQQINDIYFKVYDELYDIIREGDEMAFCYFSSWAPGKMTKLQSDISTMISVEDYRRFVQPFIRQQCQKIDYTLYHLDGVGALHHLPALLEIDELDAIQWTPGVGEPQGGSSKWYDLYRRILDGGKSIMACWVTLDELKPLLDNIGGNGVHLEMDFHNEDEVEQAMKIVEEYRYRPAAPRETADCVQLSSAASEFDADAEVERIIDEVESKFVAATDTTSASTVEIDPESPLVKALEDRILVLDGAMGTMIQSYSLTESDFRGTEFADHDCPLCGNNDLLSITSPETIGEIHRKYLEAGADIISTNTFNAQRISMADYRLENRCREINLAAGRLARRLADEFTQKNPLKPRFVAGSMGPTSKTCSLMSEGVQPGWATFGYDILVDAYEEQASALIESGVDAILIETIFDVKNAEAAVKAATSAMLKAGKSLPIMLSFSVKTPDGHNMLGQSICEFIATLTDYPILSVGINCLTDLAEMTPLLVKLGRETDRFVSVYPNAGLPDDTGAYSLSAKDFQRNMWHLLDGHIVNIIGGCCGTTDAHIGSLAQICEPIEGLRLSPHRRGAYVDFVPAAVETSAEHHHHNHDGEAECECCRPSVKPTENKAASAADGVFDAIVAGKSDDATEATRKAVEQGVVPQDIINGQMIRAMAEVGQRFQDGNAFVPQLLMAGRAMKAALEILKPMLAGGAAVTKGKVLIGTVKGDLHDIGKNLVASMLEGCGYEVVNIGIDVSADKFVEEIRRTNPDILCLSALLTTTMTYMKDVIDALKAAGLRDKVKVMVGGAPVSQNFADEIGADGYSDNANSAVALADRLVGSK